MTRDDFLRHHWDYYIVLENDFSEIERYVAFDLGDNYLYTNSVSPSNLANSLCFSNEFIKQFQAICSEIDVLMKSICQEITGNSSAGKMPEYTKIVLTKWPKIENQKVRFKRLELQPFLGWKIHPEYISPQWWPHYNDVKHNRLADYKKANLKNTVNSLAALYVLERYFVKFIGDRDVELGSDRGFDIPDSSSKLFGMVDFKTREEVASSAILYLATEEDIDPIT